LRPVPIRIENCERLPRHLTADLDGSAGLHIAALINDRCLPSRKRHDSPRFDCQLIRGPRMSPSGLPSVTKLMPSIAAPAAPPAASTDSPACPGPPPAPPTKKPIIPPAPPASSVPG